MLYEYNITYQNVMIESVSYVSDLQDKMYKNRF